ncbi:MAG: hypothetical protein H0V70_07125 [Ktedonobacteraceae bacterium]|nr:hypothetical protein [Ktedonobacteraceae bacterium]
MSRGLDADRGIGDIVHRYLASGRCDGVLAHHRERVSGNALSSVLIGSPDTIRQRIADYEAAGVQELRIIFPDVPQLNSIRRFASEFITS